MAKKRALVDAVLSVTAASDIFTQDIEDMPDEVLNKKPEPRREAEAAGDQPDSTPGKALPQTSDVPPAPSNQQADLGIVFQDLVKEIEHAQTIDAVNDVLRRANAYDFGVGQIQTINKQSANKMKALRAK
jgi:2C-methyl-D-erythritol 2,4-cyclodiphosphate synthase